MNGTDKHTSPQYMKELNTILKEEHENSDCGDLVCCGAPLSLFGQIK